ncbi:hypothetical protein ALNOE001_05330 [Candidatus Methanobinarius endosymbioticus]|uniref:Uncharacterized protein n=1 Tax=Candidatus Methanobinarius endosymbioticus TaxID=2006182 RepID=A0A366MCL7_9EURY|nr:hypothetical protein ALNOE001_05330 [Candidatus Methanobinarius endosymbioticus]
MFSKKSFFIISCSFFIVFSIMSSASAAKDIEINN